jgi:hypothetical protein
MSWFGRGKPVEVPKSGFMGDTSEEQDACLGQFKEWIVATEANGAYQYDEYDLLRFCRARKFDLGLVQLMFTNFIKWRQEEGVEDVMNTYEFPEREQVQVVYPHGYHMTDK